MRESDAMDASALDRPVREIACHDVRTAKRSDTLRTMARLMADAHCGALVVPQRSGEPAIVTERDLVMALAADADPDGEWAVDVMTREVQTVSPDTSIADVAELMQMAGFRHVLVVDEEAGPMSIVSIRDLLDPVLEAK